MADQVNQAPGFPAAPSATPASRLDARWTTFDLWLRRSIGQRARYALQEIRQMADAARRAIP